jgi:hypothetical protein
MVPLSTITKSASNNDNVLPTAQVKNFNHQTYDTDVIKAKQNDIKKSVSARIQLNYALEQDEMEGTEESEWNE